MNRIKEAKAMTIIELTIVMVISSVVLFVAMQGVGILQRMAVMQTREMIGSNTLFNDYLLLQTAIVSSDSITYSANMATVFCSRKQLCIANRDSVAVFGTDTLFKSSHRITYDLRSGSDTLFLTITSQDDVRKLSFLTLQCANNNRDREIEKTEVSFNYEEE